MYNNINKIINEINIFGKQFNFPSELIIGMIEAIKTGIIKLLFVFLAKITTKILPKKKLKPKATPIRPNVFALFSGLEISARIVVAEETEQLLMRTSQKEDKENAV